MDSLSNAAVAHLERGHRLEPASEQAIPLIVPSRPTARAWPSRGFWARSCRASVPNVFPGGYGGRDEVDTTSETIAILHSPLGIFTTLLRRGHAPTQPPSLVYGDGTSRGRSTFGVCIWLWASQSWLRSRQAVVTSEGRQWAVADWEGMTAVHSLDESGLSRLQRATPTRYAVCVVRRVGSESFQHGTTPTDSCQTCLTLHFRATFPRRLRVPCTSASTL
ncbi:hypothetical protein FB45DRAFT_367720 [Roridomyces roridus]|uniref:Uncharacterized protein n=1 Tax=Roridomyces roridus TaxID=1738132 RepID=A0AAD7FB40_9AGAR|nr:hypothetical protein FB45DRAFT_367720 [Roridomyces roridus]